MSPTEKEPEAKASSWLVNLRDLVAILGGTTVIVAALLWYFGRRYSLGYVSAMNIPTNQVNFTSLE